MNKPTLRERGLVLGVSRQRIWQLDQIAKGLCMKGDGKSIYRSNLCRVHYYEDLVRKRKR